MTCLEDGGVEGGGEWATVAPLGTARMYAAAASLNGVLYVAGGDSNDTQSSVERYWPTSDTWEAVASMTSARSEHQLVALGGFLYAVGGDGADGLVGTEVTAERYDPSMNADLKHHGERRKK